MIFNKSRKTSAAESIHELEQRVSRLLIAAYSNVEWRVIRMHYFEVGKVAGAVSEAVDVADSSQYAAIPSEALESLGALKKACATDAHGTWLSLELTIDRGRGDYKFLYNYDKKPEWDLEPLPENFQHELQYYPRPTGEVPAWFPKSIGSSSS